MPPMFGIGLPMLIPQQPGADMGAAESLFIDPSEEGMEPISSISSFIGDIGAFMPLEDIPPISLESSSIPIAGLAPDIELFAEPDLLALLCCNAACKRATWRFS